MKQIEIKGLLVLLLLLIFSSCKESKKESMIRLVNEWNGKEIKFPTRSTFTVLGKDTVDFTFDEADYKVLTYIDSVGCASSSYNYIVGKNGCTKSIH